MEDPGYPGALQTLRTTGAHIVPVPVDEDGQIAEMTLKFKRYDRQIQQLGQTEYPETQALLKVYGVGHITALTYVLTLGSKQRFQRSRDVGCYAATNLRHSATASGETGQLVFELREFYLELALAGLGMAGEDVEDELRTVDDVAG